MQKYSFNLNAGWMSINLAGKSVWFSKPNSSRIDIHLTFKLRLLLHSC